jgi:hypothetical protein
MACFDHEVRDKIEIPLEVTKALWKEAVARLEAGQEYGDIINDLAKQTNLSPYMVSRAITQPKAIRNITERMWASHIKKNELLKTARMIINDSDKSSLRKLGRRAWDSLRQAAVFGHGGVFPFTHMRDSLFLKGERDIFFDTVKRAYAYASKERGAGRWKNDMDALQRRSSYADAARYGLDIKVDAEPTGILTQALKGKSNWGRRSFDSLKTARLDLWDRVTESLGKEANPDVLRQIAKDINHATGSITYRDPRLQSAAGNVMFAPSLYFARRFAAISDPIKSLVKGGRMTPAERSATSFAINRWAKLVMIQTAIVGANAAFNKIVLGKSNVNTTDPMRSDWMRMKIGSFTVPMSPLFEALKQAIRIPVVMTTSKKNRRSHGLSDNPFAAAGEQVWRDISSSIHPTASAIVEQVSGREPWSGRSVPSLHDLAADKEPEREPKVSMLEYGLGKSPIPISGASREIYQALRDNGMNASDAMVWIRGAINMISSGALGTHAHGERVKTDFKHMSKDERDRIEKENSDFRWY